MAYRKLVMDCLNTPVGIKQKLVEIGQEIDEVVILSFPANVSVLLAFGDSDLFTVSGPISFQPRGADEQLRGLYWQNVAVNGSQIEVLVVSGGSAVGARGVV